ncbi:hypothetical protein H6B10_17705, partial [Gemmiger formicilis]|nr:hypothetical protein [Gemmiger formicilis]
KAVVGSTAFVLVTQALFRGFGPFAVFLHNTPGTELGIDKCVEIIRDLY